MANRTRLTDAQIEEELQKLNAGGTNWQRDGDELTTELEFADFNEAFGFLTRLALYAERADHHPEIWNVYNKVRLRLSTHDAGGITALDFALAAKANGAL